MRKYLEIAENPNSCPDILRKILKRGKNNWASGYNSEYVMIICCLAAQNPNCPQDLLRKILERGKDDYISWFASRNLNCPSEIYIRWMKDTGRIGKENPKLHIIDKVEIEIDEDLEKLKKMVNY